MNRIDNRKSWTFELITGDTIILIPYTNQDTFKPKKVMVEKITKRFVIIEGGIKFSRVTLYEVGITPWYANRIEEYTIEKWNNYLFNKENKNV